MSLEFPQTKLVDYAALAENAFKKAELAFKSTGNFWRLAKSDSHYFTQEELMIRVNEACNKTLTALRYTRNNLEQAKDKQTIEAILQALIHFKKKPFLDFRRLMVQFGNNNVRTIPAHPDAEAATKNEGIHLIPNVVQETEEALQYLIQTAETILTPQLPIELWEKSFEDLPFKTLIVKARVCKEWERVILETVLPCCFERWCKEISRVVEVPDFFSSISLPASETKVLSAMTETIASTDWLKQCSPFSSLTEVKAVFLKIQKVVKTIVAHAASIEKCLFFFNDSNIDESLFRRAIQEKITSRINGSCRLEIRPEKTKSLRPIFWEIMADSFTKTRQNAILIELQNLSVNDRLIMGLPNHFFSEKFATLNFSNNQIGGEGLLHICKQLKSMRCSSINLDNNKVTNNGILNVLKEMEGTSNDRQKPLTIRLMENPIKADARLTDKGSKPSWIEFILP